jgi:hypothetical protein
MPLYRKKPVVIEAVQWDGKDYDTLAGFLGPEMYSRVGFSSRVPGETPASVHITTLAGVMIASPGDWIIKGVKVEFYPVKDPIFQETYELATDETAPDLEA